METNQNEKYLYSTYLEHDVLIIMTDKLRLVGRLKSINNEFAELTHKGQTQLIPMRNVSQIVLLEVRA